MDEGASKNINISISFSSFVKIVVFGILIYAFFRLTNLILIVLTSIVIASFVVYMVNKMSRFVKSRVASVLIIYLIIITVIIAISSVFVPIFINEISLLVKQLGNYIPDNSFLNNLQPSSLSETKNLIVDIKEESSLGEVIRGISSFMNSFSGGFLNIFNAAFGGILNIILILVISFYLSITDKGVENFLRIITPIKYEEYVIDLWKRTELKIGLWAQGQMLMGVIMGMLAYLGLTIIGVKYSLILSIIVLVTEIIPFGLVIATIPAVIFAFLDGGFVLALITIGLYFLLGQFESYLIYPLVIKKATGVSPLVVILAVLIGLELAGLWGVFLAVPFAVCLLEFLDDLEKKKISVRNS